MPADNGVTIKLTGAQVAQVVRRAGTGPSSALSGLSDPKQLASGVQPLIDGEKYSRSTLRALLVLAAFPSDGSPRELSDLARQLGFSASTTHRYVSTWLAVGMLEQDPLSRKYRLAPRT